MWSSCIKFIIFVQSASFWYICRYWIKRDFATFNHMSSCWEINVSIFLFISGNVISATEDIICSSPVAPVVSKMVASIGCCWGPPDFFAFEFRSLFLPGYGAILQYQNPPLLLTYSPLAFAIGMGFLRGCILSIHTAWSVLTLKLTEKNVLFKLWSNVTYLQHVYVNGHGIGKHEFSLHERHKLRDEELLLFFFNSLLTLRSVPKMSISF